MGAEKTLGRLLSGTADASVRFDDLCHLLESLGFEKGVRGSHYMFRKSAVEEKINLQAGRYEREAVPGQTGPVCDCEGKTRA